nr:MAG TPA: hypothetical protein [Caudoviricetes sp.]
MRVEARESIVPRFLFCHIVGICYLCLPRKIKIHVHNREVV